MSPHEIIQAIISGATAIILLFGFWFSVKKFKQEQMANRLMEFNQKQFSLYMEVSHIAAILATEDNSSHDYKEAEKEFWRLYFGSLCIVEHRKVEATMVQLGAALQSNASKDQLQKLSLTLAASCRKEVDERMRADLGELPTPAA